MLADSANVVLPWCINIVYEWKKYLREGKKMLRDSQIYPDGHTNSWKSIGRSSVTYMTQEFYILKDLDVGSPHPIGRAWRRAWRRARRGRARACRGASRTWSPRGCGAAPASRCAASARPGTRAPGHSGDDTQHSQYAFMLKKKPAERKSDSQLSRFHINPRVSGCPGGFPQLNKKKD